jgi:hypothetical protein
MAEGTYVSELEEGALVEATFAVQRSAGDAPATVTRSCRWSWPTAPAASRPWSGTTSTCWARGSTRATRCACWVASKLRRRPQIAVRDVERLEQGDALELVPGARRDAETLDGMVEFLAAEIHVPACPRWWHGS